ncbi:MAG: AMP-dependent synthetase [Rhodobacteraceae bacterium]|nr:MAG: AMP-dependent synthetase [Paracoccaceae bacterium]
MNYLNKKYPLADLLEKGSGPAIKSADKLISYNALRSNVLHIGQQLATLGIKPGDSVGIVTPNGPESAAIFISVASFATAAPLNPRYTKEEFKFYLTDLDAKILIVSENVPIDPILAASELGIKTIKIKTTDQANEITLTEKNEILRLSPATYNQANDVSLVLHTSGTTSRPKIVPLTADNICVSARNIARTLKLSDSDSYLNIMPLFHIHGLVAGVLATLESGGSMFCTDGFDTLKFFKILNMVKPTWFSGVPTMHQSILSRAPRNYNIAKSTNLRFIRSSSASLPVSVLGELEATFKCPVIEAYGMTEAAHQMASNPLPPFKRKPGTVGIAAGPSIEILSNDGKILSANKIGEIVIKGANVTKGYQNNPDANKQNFIDGWFRTGDQGIIDKDGFLTITGRLKEIINRGGEKISPKEIDEALLSHFNVSEAVTFSVPHEILGEDVGAALVLIDKTKTTVAELKEHLKTRIADFKIPRNIVLLEEIPKGATGKIQRMNMAKILGFIK